MPNSIRDVSFQQLDPYSLSLRDTERRRLLSEALQQQSLQPMGGTEVIGGWAVPRSPMEGVAKIAQALSGAYGQKKAAEREQDIGAKYQNDLQTTLQRALQAGSGTPGRDAITLPDDQAGPVQPAQPAVPPDMTRMGSILMEHPGTMAMGEQQMMQDMNVKALVAALQSGNAAQATSAPTGQGNAPTGVPGATGSQNSLAPAGGSPALAWLRSDPTGKSYMEALAKQNAPINVRQGGAVYDPVTGVPRFVNPQSIPGVQIGFGQGGANATPIPGYNDAAAGVTAATSGAQAKAKAPWETVPVQSASGATVPTPLTQIPGIGQPPGGQAPAPQPGAAPAQSPAIRMDMPTNAAALEQAQKLSGTGQQFAIRGPDPWADIPKPSVPTGIGQTTYNRELDTSRAQTVTKLAEKFGTAAETANQRKALNDQALGLVDSSDTGPSAATIAEVKNLLVSRFGISEDRFKNTPSATIALQKDLVNAATAKAKQQFASRITQSEVNLMLQRGSPNVDMTKAAIKYLIKSDNAAADYQTQQANDFGKYVQMGGDPMRFEAWYSQKFPMTQALGAVHLGGGGKSAVDLALEKYK